MPREIRLIRAEAQDALGFKKDALQTLEALAADSDEPGMLLRLYRGYISIGAVRDAARPACRLVEMGCADPHALISFAWTMRDEAPATAEAALERVASLPGLTEQQKSVVMRTAMEAGAHEIHQRMMHELIVSAVSGASKYVRRIDSVEEFIEAQKAQALAKADRLLQWLNGRFLSHWFDLAAFTRLYLGEREDRVEQGVRPYPLALRFGDRSTRKAALDGKSRIVLRIDISALLLAEHLGLTSNLDQFAKIKVPHSVGHCLLEAEASLDAQNEQTLSVWDTTISEARNLEIVDDFDTAVEDPDRSVTPSGIRTSVIRAIISLAARRGEIGSVAAKNALDGLDDDSEPGEPAAELPDRIELSFSEALFLNSRSLLRAVCEVTNIRIKRTEVESAVSELAKMRRRKSVSDRLSQIRGFVSSKLKAGRWTTTPALHDAEFDSQPERPIQLRCLLEMLRPKFAEDEFVWIDDRFISAGGFPQQVDIIDLLQPMLESGAVNFDRRRAVLELLQNLGYSYVAPDVDTIVTRMAECPISEGEVVENPELSAIRRWYASEVDDLRFVHLETAANPDGSMAGEIRHALAIHGLLRDTLRVLWFERDPGEATMAQSRWVWRCLRFDQVDFLPVNDSSFNGRRTLLALQFASLIHVPMLILLGEPSFEENRIKRFLDFIFGVVIESATRTDPILRERTAEIVSATLINVSQKEYPFDEIDAAEIEAVVTIRVNRFLTLLPPEWSDLICSNNGLGALLGRVKHMETYIEEDGGLPVAGLSRALATCLEASNTPTECLVDEGRKAMVEFQKREGSIPRVTVSVNDRRYEMDQVTVALAYPDLSDRVNMLTSLHDCLDLPRSERLSILTRVAQEPDPDARFRSFDDVQRANFAWILRATEQPLASGRLDLDLIDLPSPSSLLKHLRIGQGNWSDIRPAIASAHDLRRELGALEAARRVGGVPLEFDKEFLNAISNELDAVGEFGGPDTALYALILVHSALACEGATTEKIESRLRGLIDAATTTAPLFVTMIHFGESIIESEPTWLALPFELRAALLWCYADQITRIFSRAGADLDRAAEILNANQSANFRPILERKSKSPPWYLAMTTELTVAKFNTTLVSNLVPHLATRSIDESVMASLKSLAGTSMRDGWLPSIETLFLADDGPAELWPTRAPIRIFSDAGWFGDRRIFDVGGLSDQIVELISPESGSSDPRFAAALLSTVPTERLHEADRRLILEFLNRSRLLDTLPMDDAIYQRAFVLEARLFGVEGDFDGISKEIRANARRASRQWPCNRIAYDIGARTNESNAALITMFEAIFQFAAFLPMDSSRKIQAVAELSEAMAAVWPKSLLGIIGTLDRIAGSSDVELASELWPALLRLRSRP